MEITAQLNLARKWRSQQFDHIIGQDLSVRMLKNSLYKEQFFPVYLFSGQKGCGKTTTARVFASAINCEKFSSFKKQPRSVIIPCLDCNSCYAMQQGKHPDFIEIDAASHTGVDNIRSIIDASSFMPLMGRKKIYLIDEAHMLSKAAFNAFLKILEEPPVTALFILATTDAHKIIDTVCSRCFQLFFKPIKADILVRHLKEVCEQEAIVYEQEGLQLIVQETEGSARDALNMLEAVRFSAASVTKDAVLQTLGHVQDEYVIQPLEAVLACNAQQVLQLLKAIDRVQCSAQFLWQKWVHLLHAAICIKHDIEPDMFVLYVQRLKRILQRISWLHIKIYLDLFYRNEITFQKTAHQHDFFQMLLLQLCTVKTKSDSNNFDSGCSSEQSIGVSIPSCIEESEDAQEEQESDIENDQEMHWQTVIQEISLLEDPLIISIFKQGVYRAFDPARQELFIVFSKRFVFFKDWLDNTQSVWHPILKKYFGEKVIFIPEFTAQDVESIKKETSFQTQSIQSVIVNQVEKAVVKQSRTSQQVPYKHHYTAKQRVDPAALPLNMQDGNAWNKAQLILSYFPGAMYEIKELSSS